MKRAAISVRAFSFASANKWAWLITSARARCRDWCRACLPFISGPIRQKIEPVKAALLEEISKLATEGLTAEELARAKKKLIGQQQIANQSNDSFGYQCALDELYGLGFDHYKTLEREVEKVTLDEIKRVAAKYFRDQPYVLATVRPPEASCSRERRSRYG